MSKRKGRKSARSSEIKSVLRAPPEGESEPGAEAREAADPDSDTLPLDVLGEAVDLDASRDADRDARLDGPSAPESGIPESAPAPAEAAPSADESEAAPPARSPGRPRARRLRAVSAREAVTVEEESGDVSEGSDEPSPDGDTLVVERNSEELEARADVDDADEGERKGDDEREAGDGESDDEPFEPIPLEIDGDDTEGFLRGLLEALLFTSQKPLDLKDLARSAGVDKPRAKELLEQLMASYEGRGLCVEQVAGGYVMRSSPRYAPYVQKILSLKPVRLSRAQLETLAIVAYRQPVTKPEVDDIRGVDSGQVIKGLLERSLLKMLGKKDEPGRPTLYGTTNDFLELLNLQSLKDLPTLREYTELSEESQRKFLEETGETPPSGELSFERPNGDAVAPDGDAAGASAAAGESGELSERQDGSGEEDPAEAERPPSSRDEADEDDAQSSRPVASDESQDDEALEDDAPRAGVEDDDEESDDDEDSDDDASDEDDDDEDSDDDDDDEDEDEDDDDDDDD